MASVIIREEPSIQRARRPSSFSSIRGSFSALKASTKSKTNDSKQLRVLICTTNAGNAEPSPESIAAWIPQNGDMNAVMKESKYKVGFDAGSDVANVLTKIDEHKDFGQFDIIAIGMQESTFRGKATKKKRLSFGLDDEEEDPNENAWAEEKKQDKNEEKAPMKEKKQDKNEEKAPMTVDRRAKGMKLFKELDSDRLLRDNLFPERARNYSHRLTKTQRKSTDEENSSSESILENNLSESHLENNTNERKLEDRPSQRKLEDRPSQRKLENRPSQRKLNINVSYTLIKKKRGSNTLMSKHSNTSFDSAEDEMDDESDDEEYASNPNLVESNVRGSRSKSKITNFYDTAKLTIRSATVSENHIARTGHEFICKAQSYGKDTRILHKLISERCPNYVFVVNYLHGAIRLMVMVKRKLVKELEDVTCKAVSTGIGSVLRNKGGIVATVKIRKTKLAFISAHLAAHEGYKYYQNRNNDVSSILDGGKTSKYDASLENHHCFLFGDLNYRLKYPSMFSDPSLAVQRAVDQIKKNQWTALNDLDELQKGLKNKDMMVGFTTPLCLFPPTFKVQREAGFNYLSQRTPSFTDRILWKSNDGLERGVKALLYEPVEYYTDSDHKPIRGAFYVSTNSQQYGLVHKIREEMNSFSFRCKKKKRKKRNRRSSNARSSLLAKSMLRISSLTAVEFTQTLMYISDMMCYGLNTTYSNDSSNSVSASSYYIMFDTDPKVLSLCERKTPSINNPRQIVSTCQKSIARDANGEILDWGEEMIDTEIEDGVSLTGAMIYISLMEKTAKHKQNYMVGTVALNLEHMCNLGTYAIENQLKEFDIDQPLLKNGRSQGNLKCNIFVTLDDE